MSREKLEEGFSLIGWPEAAQLAPVRARSLRGSIEASPTRPGAADRQVERLQVEDLDRTLHHLEGLLDALPKLLAQSIDTGGLADDRAEPRPIDAIRATLPRLRAGVEFALETTAGDADGARPRGRRKNEHAHYIAGACVEIFVLANGRPPPYGRSCIDASPTGNFTKGVALILDGLGCLPRDVVACCKKAVQALSPEEIANIALHRLPAAWLSSRE